MAPLLFKEAKRDIQVSGVWKADFETQRGLQKYEFNFKQDGNQVTGSATAELDGSKTDVVLRDFEFKKIR